MKKKLVIVLIGACSFICGLSVEKSYINTNTRDNMVDVSQIVDWNTDGEELAVFTKDGYEYYMYKSQDIYTNKCFVPIEK